MNNRQRLYTEMSAEEQAAWVTEYEELAGRLRGVIEAAARRRGPSAYASGTVAAAKRRSLPSAYASGTVAAAGTVAAVGTVAGIRRLFALLGAWGFAQEFCEKARRYGDYMARVPRLPVYMEKVNDALAEGLTTTDAQGRRVAVVLPGVPARRRGRPSNAEVAARLRGVPTADAGGTAADSAETKKRRAIARLLGVEVVAGEPVREKNNAELAAERAAREAERERREPGLFPAADAGGTGAPGDSPAPSGNNERKGGGGRDDEGRPAADAAGTAAASPCAQLMSDGYEMRMAQDKLHLNQLAWMMSDGLQERVATVQGLRVTSERASERAKMLAEQGADAAAIEPYAQQAKEATEAYLAIYEAVDEELATVFYRLQNDEPFREKFVRRFKGVDLVRVAHICRPYYEKLRSPEFDLRVRSIIEQESPEYAARMKAEEEKKREVTDILRYLKRKDKDASDTRLKSAKEVKFPRLVELMGEEEAKNYYPLITYIEEENRKWREAGKGKDGTGTEADAPGTTAAGGDGPAISPAHSGGDERKPAADATGTTAASKKTTRKQSKKTRKEENNEKKNENKDNGNGNNENQNENKNGKEE